MSFSDPRYSSRRFKSQGRERNIYLGLELLEERNLLSASAAGMLGSGMPDGGGQAASPATPATVGPAPPAMVVTQPALAAASAAAAPADSGSVSGYVFFAPTPGAANFNPTSPPAGEAPLAGVTVTLNGPGGTQTAVTDATGVYTFSDLAPGTYSLSVTPPSGDANTTSIPNGNGTAGTGSISDITITAGQSQANENFPITVAAGAKSQLQQIYFTASLLVSGVQIPLAPFEQVVAPIPQPNVPQQVGPAVPLPGITGRTFQIAGGTSLPQGGSGGDAIIGGANPASPLYSGNVQDEIWPAFGEQGVNNWLNEGFDQDITQQLNDLGNLNLLNSGGNRGQYPGTSSGESLDGDDLLRGGGSRQNDPFNINDRLFNLNDGEINGRGFLPDNDPFQNDSMGVGSSAGNAVLLDRVTAAPISASRLPTDDAWSPTSSASAAAVAAWMLVTGNRSAQSGSRVSGFDRRRKG